MLSRGESCCLGKHRPQHYDKTWETTVGWFCRSFCMCNSPPAREHEDELIFALRTSAKMTCGRWTWTSRGVKTLPTITLIRDTIYTGTTKDETDETVGWSVTEVNKKKNTSTSEEILLQCIVCNRDSHSRVDLYRHNRCYAATAAEALLCESRSMVSPDR